MSGVGCFLVALALVARVSRVLVVVKWSVVEWSGVVVRGRSIGPAGLGLGPAGLGLG